MNQLDGDIVSEALKYAWGAPDPTIVGMVEMVCQATRRAAIVSVTSALSIAVDHEPHAAERMHDAAHLVLARATVMQHEMDLFVASTEPIRRGAPDPSRLRES